MGEEANPIVGFGFEGDEMLIRAMLFAIEIDLWYAKICLSKL